MVYSRPDLYALAYGYRDVGRECAFALGQAGRALGRPARSACELAAGPALHGRWLAANGLRVAAVEKNPTAAEWLRDQAPELQVVPADLAAFDLDSPVDLMLCPLSGLAYLATDEAWHRALACIARNLTPRGLLAAELAPGDRDRSVADEWSVPLADGRLDVWAGPSEAVAPDLYEWTLRLTLHRGRCQEVLETVERQRAVTAPQAQQLLEECAELTRVRAWDGWSAARYRAGGALVLTAQRAAD